MPNEKETRKTLIALGIGLACLAGFGLLFAFFGKYAIYILVNVFMLAMALGVVASVVYLLFNWNRIFQASSGQLKDAHSCSSCGARLSESEMRKDEATMRIEAAMGGTDPRDAYTPNLLSRSALKCEGCGAWLCCHCAERAALNSGSGMLKHANCGGMFKNPA